MTNKLGGDSAFPNTYDADRFRGLTYRQYLAAQIAGKVARSTLVKHTEAEFFTAYGLTVWKLVDAVLEAENVKQNDG